MSPLSLATWFGSALLIAVAALPTKVAMRVGTCAVLIAAWVTIGVLVVRDVPARSGYMPRTDPARVIKQGTRALAKAINKPKSNLIVVEGGSYAARAINTSLLQKELRKLGYRADLVQLTMAAANHFERHTVFSDLLNASKLEELEEHPNVVLMAEVQVNYDAQPLDQLQENQDTYRAFHYLSPANAAYALWSLWVGGGTRANLERPVWTVVRHALVNAFNVGLVERVRPASKIRSMQGYVGGGIKGKYRFTGLAPVRKQASGPLAEIEKRPWIFTVRQARMQKLWGTRLDRWVYYGVPSTNSKQMIWTRSVCAETTLPCIAPSDSELLGALDAKENWRDAGHLTSRGSHLYTKWLAKQLVGTGTLEK
jgi:hypothetical protein